LRRRVQVAEPNSKALTQVGAFSFPPWTLTRDYVPGYSALRASPLRGRAEARSAAPSSPGRGAKFKSPDASRGFFVSPPPWTLTRDCVPGYSALRASPLRGRAEARSAAPSSPGRGAKFKSPDASRGFFVSGSFEFWRLKPLLPLPHE